MSRTIRFRRPTIEPLHRKGYPRPATGPGADDFRVTQQFDDPDYYWIDKDPEKAALGHRATDIGNGRCGYPIVAMADGRARLVQDNAKALGAATNALGVIVDHGDGVTTEVWHLASWSVRDGAPVVSGQQIGIHGATGLGAVCHAHIEAKVNGIRVDPEPLMFGGSITVGAAAAEADMQIRGKYLRHVTNRRGALAIDSNFRAGVDAGDDESLAVMPKGTAIIPVVVVEGRPVGTAADRAEWYGVLNWIPVQGYVLGYYHSSVLPRTADGNGVALDEIEAVGSGMDAAEVAAAVSLASRTAWAAGRDAAVKAGAAVKPPQ